MKKFLLMTAMMVALFISLSACSTVIPGKVIYSDKLSEIITPENTKVVILIDANDKIRVYNALGTSQDVTECRIPKPNQDEKSGQDSKLPVCKGLMKGSAVTGIETISVLRTNSQTCYIVAWDHNGNPIQVCWPPQ